MKFFDLDSPLMQGLNKLADLLWLNVLTLICCIPIITVGASLTAMHYMALKMARGEECYITKDFFKSFKRNFKQGTAIWLILVLVIVIMVSDFVIIQYSGMEFNSLLEIVLMAIALLMYFTSMFLFPVLAKFENTVYRTFRNAFYIGVLQLPKTVLMMILTVLPLFLVYLFPQIMPLVFLFGMSVPAWVSALLYNKFFKRLEEQSRGAQTSETEETQEDDERIFKDELDPALMEDKKG